MKNIKRALTKSITHNTPKIQLLAKIFHAPPNTIKLPPNNSKLKNAHKITGVFGLECWKI